MPHPACACHGCAWSVRAGGGPVAPHVSPPPPTPLPLQRHPEQRAAAPATASAVSCATMRPPPAHPPDPPMLACKHACVMRSIEHAHMCTDHCGTTPPPFHPSVLRQARAGPGLRWRLHQAHPRVQVRGCCAPRGLRCPCAAASGAQAPLTAFAFAPLPLCLRAHAFHLSPPLEFAREVRPLGACASHNHTTTCHPPTLHSADQMESFGGETPYSIMFGPDICGYSTKKVRGHPQQAGRVTPPSCNS